MVTVWPEVFMTGKLTSQDERSAIADGLVGWANCQMGSKPPEKFGEGMVAIGQLLGISATGEKLMEYSEKFV